MPSQENRPTPGQLGTDVASAVLETLAYSDVFGYPLTLEELHRYLPVRISREMLWAAIERQPDRIAATDGYFFLPGRDTMVDLRERRTHASSSSFKRAIRWGRLLGRLPFIRMVALTGSLALLNCDSDADFDFLLVAAPGRVWTARGFAVLLGRIAALGGDRLCPNVIVAEDCLDGFARDLYSARELCQMIPLAGMPTYLALRRANAWTETFLPNAGGAPIFPTGISDASRLRSVGEAILSGALGDRLEAWEMARKIRRLSRQAGYGQETIFNSRMCQGNFSHHRAHTLEAFKARLQALGLPHEPQLARRPGLASNDSAHSYSALPAVER